MNFTPLSKRNRPKLVNGKLVAALAIILVWLLYGELQYSKAVKNGYIPTDTKKQIILIQKGASAKTVGKILETKGIVENGSHLAKFLKKEDKTEKILAGRFELSPSMSIRQIAQVITDPMQAKNYITIPEGFGIKQIDERLTEQQIAKSGEFIEATKKFNDYTSYTWLPKKQMLVSLLPLEGFLFPDTYRIDPANFSSNNLIRMMLDNFEKKLPTNTAELLKEKNITLYELITVASMLEKEVKHEEDLPIVAGIIWKRVNSGWFLNIDATILYGIGKKTIASANLKEDGPYNTYTRKGLPLGPIGNPGLKATEAALNPTKTSYWFYLTNPKTGKAIYATSNDGHNRNRAMYLQ